MEGRGLLTVPEMAELPAAVGAPPPPGDGDGDGERARNNLDLIVGSQTLAEHRVHVTQVFTKLAQRQHSIHPSKASFLKKDIEYLGHMSTPFGTRPTAKHVWGHLTMGLFTSRVGL